jgi:type IV secretory pathway protease TraF
MSTGLRIFAATVLLSIVVATGFRWGSRSAEKSASPPGKHSPWFEIQGDSMAPTLVAGQRCRVSSPDATLQIGDIVAIDWDGKARVKRIAGLGGDTIDCVEGRLLVNGRRLEDVLVSRSDSAFVKPSRVPVGADQNAWRPSESHSGWWIYHHHNRHAGGRLTAVMDDYPINVDVKRRLNPVDRLAVQIRTKAARNGGTRTRSTVSIKPTVPPPSDTPRIRVAFFIDQRVLVAKTMPDTEVVSREAKPDRSGELPRLDARHPIAIEMPGESRHAFQLEVWREIEYRTDQAGEAIRYPIRLGEDELFVVGDNVPVSVDSRSLGPVHRAQLLGRLLPADVSPTDVAAPSLPLTTSPTSLLRL